MCTRDFSCLARCPLSRAVLAGLQMDPAASESNRRALGTATVELTDIIEPDREKIAEE